MTSQSETSYHLVLLRQIGEALYGPQWQSDLSRAISVSDRTMRRWAAGTDEVPEGVWLDIHRHAESRWRTIKYFDEEIMRMLATLEPIPNAQPQLDLWGVEFAMHTHARRRVGCMVRREVFDDHVKGDRWRHYFDDNQDVFYRIARRKFAAGELHDGKVVISNTDIADEINAEEKACGE